MSKHHNSWRQVGVDKSLHRATLSGRGRQPTENCCGQVRVGKSLHRAILSDRGRQPTENLAFIYKIEIS